ncbi:hypothetical protein CR511_12010 [Pseudomonas putida]|jgi:hypothetical protein|nr:hypothetical protein CR511_12010 [Pseudomonas putida]
MRGNFFHGGLKNYRFQENRPFKTYFKVGPNVCQVQSLALTELISARVGRHGLHEEDIGYRHF